MNEFVILGLVAIVVLTILLLVTIISLLNRMVRLEKLIEDAWSNIDVLLKTYPGNALKGERTPKPFFMKDY